MKLPPVVASCEVPVLSNAAAVSGDEHAGVCCICCHQAIVGFRYKCVVCPNYDICARYVIDFNRNKFIPLILMMDCLQLVDANHREITRVMTWFACPARGSIRLTSLRDCTGDELDFRINELQYKYNTVLYAPKQTL